MGLYEFIPRISESIEKDRNRIVDFFVQMLRINSVNPRMGGPGEIERADFIQRFLESEGFRVSRIDVPDRDYKGGVRPNLSSKIEGRDRTKTLWFLSHMDTVPEGSRDLWNTDPFDPVVKDGKIFARGAEDNGQALVSSLFALRELKLLGIDLPFNVGVWAVADEEYGSDFGVKYLLSHKYFMQEDLMIVPDAGTADGLTIEIAEKNLLWFKITTQGKQVHASTPSRGKNAHRSGMELALNLDRVLHQKYTKTNELFDEPPSTFEPTKIEANVPNINTVPGMDVFYFDCRVLPEYSLDDVLFIIKDQISLSERENGVKISLDIINRDDAGPPTLASSPVAQLLEKAIYVVTKKQPKLVGIGGLTVGNLLRKEGFPTAVWSTVEDIPHEPNEYSKIENLLTDAKVFAAIPLVSD
ncbi:MAG: M20 family metallo-hydrolase [Thaumarchaeota archaeon]|nr:M20 family metallo-hydrolase [Nitrososphaerota archaeon]